jgi:hypothetical protein
LIVRLVDGFDEARASRLEMLGVFRNKNTRQAYYHATVRFFAWCGRHKIGEIADIEPLRVATYIEALAKEFESG